MDKRQQQIRASRTMPQLNYTEADIQEQYLTRAPEQRRVPAGPAGGGGHRQQTAEQEQHQSLEWRRSQQLAKFDDGAAPSDDEAQFGSSSSRPGASPHSSRRLSCDRVEGELEDGSRTSRTDSSKAGGLKRKRRSRSASRLLSACLNIPAQLASSISSHHQQLQAAAHKTKTSSILSHFRLGGQHNHQQKRQQQQFNDENDEPDEQFHREINRRPLSNSRTMGDLQPGPFLQGTSGSSNDSPQTQPGRMKHVSFGEHQQNQQALQRAPTEAQQTNVIASSSSASLKQANKPASTGTVQVDERSPFGGPTPSQSRLSQPPPINRQPASCASPSMSGLQGAARYHGNPEQQQQHPHQNHQPPLQYVIGARKPQQIQQSRAGGGTIYKRLPNIPMRTQATQTEITAYHLMASPSGQSSVGSCSLAGTLQRTHQHQQQPQQQQQQQQPDQLTLRSGMQVETTTHDGLTQERANGSAETPNSSQASVATTLAPATSASSNQTPVISSQKSISASSSDHRRQQRREDRQQQQQQQTGDPTRPRRAPISANSQPTAGGDDKLIASSTGYGSEHDRVGAIPVAAAETGAVVASRDAEGNDDEEEEEAELGQSLRASLLNSSSNSSSSVSLVGHDSALADTLKCDLRIGASPALLVDESRPQMQTQSQKTSIIGAGSGGGAPASSTTSSMTSSRQTNDETPDAAEMLNNRERPSEIEPPNKFKDGQTATRRTSASAAATKAPTRVEWEQQKPPQASVAAELDPSGANAARVVGERELGRGEDEEEDNDDGDDEDDDEARTSPPSLSEASSQTDASMASSHILDRIGWALERQATASSKTSSGAAQRRSSATTAGSTTTIRRRHRQISIDNDATRACPRSTGGVAARGSQAQNMPSDSGPHSRLAESRPRRSMSGEAAKTKNVDVVQEKNDENPQAERLDEKEVEIPRTTARVGVADASPAAVESAETKTLPAGGPNRRSSTGLARDLQPRESSLDAAVAPATILQRRDDFLTGSPAPSVDLEDKSNKQITASVSEQPPSLATLADDDELDEFELEQSAAEAPDQQLASLGGAAGGDLRASDSDELLDGRGTICVTDATPLAAAAAAAVTTPVEAHVERQLVDHQIQLAMSQAIESRSSQPSTTSTLSTRHHSYCSTDDFQSHERQLAGQLAPGGDLFDAALDDDDDDDDDNLLDADADGGCEEDAADDFVVLDGRLLREQEQPEVAPAGLDGSLETTTITASGGEELGRQLSAASRASSTSSSTSSSCCSGQTLKSAGRRNTGETLAQLAPGFTMAAPSDAKPEPTKGQAAAAAAFERATSEKEFEDESSGERHGAEEDTRAAHERAVNRAANKAATNGEISAIASAPEKQQSADAINSLGPSAAESAHKISNDDHDNDNEDTEGGRAAAPTVCSDAERDDDDDDGRIAPATTTKNLGQQQRQQSRGSRDAQSLASRNSTSSSSGSSSGRSTGAVSSSGPKVTSRKESLRQPTGDAEALDEAASDQREQHQQIESSAGGSARKTSSPSPPTTVSDLDQDEELSTPSFVDNYKRRLEDHVNELADSFSNNLIDEGLAAVMTGGEQAGANGQRDRANGDAEVSRGPPNNNQGSASDRASRSRSASTASASNGSTSSAANSTSTSTSTSTATATSTTAGASTTTTTSAGGSSYVRLDDGQLKRRSQLKEQDFGSSEQQQRVRNQPVKPELPKKPAHLVAIQAGSSCSSEQQLQARAEQVENEDDDDDDDDAHRDERATAVAVTATSIAAAVARHATNGAAALIAAPRDEHRQEVETTRRKSYDGIVATNGHSTGEQQDAHGRAPSSLVETGPVSNPSKRGVSTELPGNADVEQFSLRPTESSLGPHDDYGERSPDGRRTVGGEQSPLELSTVSEASDEVSPGQSSVSQQQLSTVSGSTVDGDAGGEQGRSADGSQVSERTAGGTSTSLIRQLSGSFESRSSSSTRTQATIASNRANQKQLSLGEQSTSGGSGSATPQQAATPRASTSTTANLQARCSSPVDCPYVTTMTTPAKITTERRSSAGASITSPLQPSDGSLASICSTNDASASAASAAAVSGANYPSKRLSHDDTMEAIEDDVEGEEQEMKLLDELQKQRVPLSHQAIANIAPPAGFCTASSSHLSLGATRPGSSLSGPSPVSGQSIQEEDEDEGERAPGESLRIQKGVPPPPSGSEGDDDDDEDEEEESSVSVSQKHGVVVTQEGSRRTRPKASPGRFHGDKSTIRMKRFKRSSSNSSSSSSISADSNRATPVMSSPNSTPSKSSNSATVSSRSPSKAAGDSGADRSDKSELLARTPTRERVLLEANTTSTSSSAAHNEAADDRKNAPSSIGGADSIQSQSVEQSFKMVDKSDECPADQSDSTESATHAILEHLSRHHHHPAIGSAAMALDEPAPSLELCRSIDPQQRRASWRRESETSRGASSANHSSSQSQMPTSLTVGEAGQQLEKIDQSREMPAHVRSANDNPQHADGGRFEHSDSPSRTGTMKRRRRKSNSLENSEPEVADTAAQESITSIASKRGTPPASSVPPLAGDAVNVETAAAKRPPPLGRLKSPLTDSDQQQQQQQQQSSGTLDRADVDGSICSSCSCMETSFDQTIATREPMPQITEVRPSTSTSASASASASTSTQQQPQQPAPSSQQPRSSNSSSWMSQEEGTVFTENYWLSHWLYISEHEEAEIWRRAIDLGRSTGGNREQQNSDEHCEGMAKTRPKAHTEAGLPDDMTETSSTISERSFNTRYKSTTRKMIHRRASIEMFKRIMSNNLKKEKRVEISRSSVGEFGFRIHGSRPVVVSAIERGTSAETCGLQVGDLIYAINDINILDMAHSDVVRLAHDAGSSALILDLIPTNDFLQSKRYSRLENKRYEPTVTGYLMRLSPSTAQPLLIQLQERMSSSGGSVSSQQRAIELNKVMRLAWRARYFVLRSDNCLYWYESPDDMVEPHGGLNLQGFSATLTDEFSEPDYVIRLVKYGGQPHYLGSNNMCDIQTWVDAINRAATEANQNDPYMKRTLVLARGKPTQILEPDCTGWLYKFSHKRGGGAHWRAAYFVLKDACLYLFRNQKAELVDQASAVYYLHGYRVRSKHIEHKKYTFELIPPNRKTIKPMFLMASNEIDKKRWIAALEYSIDRWIEVN